MGDDGPGSDVEQVFDAELYEIASNYAHIMNVAMDVPSAVSHGFGRRGYVPVIGTADDAPLQATLVPAGGGRHRLYLDGAVRSKIGKGPGDTVRISVRFDPSDRMPEVPDDLLAGLEAAGALGQWEALTPSRRKELLIALADAKREDTRRRRLATIVEIAVDEGGRRLG